MAKVKREPCAASQVEALEDAPRGEIRYRAFPTGGQDLAMPRELVFRHGSTVDNP